MLTYCLEAATQGHGKEKNMPEGVKEEQELILGGDIRIEGDTWLRQVWEEAAIARVQREAAVRRVVCAPL